MRRIASLAVTLTVLVLTAAGAASARPEAPRGLHFSTVLVKSHHYQIKACQRGGTWYLQGTKHLKKKIFVLFKFRIEENGSEIYSGSSSLSEHGPIVESQGSGGFPTSVLTFKAKFYTVHGTKKLGTKKAVVSFGSIAPC